MGYAAGLIQILHAGREMLLDEELSEASIVSELAPVSLQLALIDARQGDAEAAEAAFKVLACLRWSIQESEY